MSSTSEVADQAYARSCAARADLLAAVSGVARTQEWKRDGARDLASWLAARWQISGRTARELVRDAEALTERPALENALSRGSISTDQCRALTVLCEPGTDDDALWLEALPFWSLSELEREARKKKARELERRDGGVYLRMSHTADERYMRGEFQLHPEDGAAVLRAVEDRIPAATPWRKWDRARAEALVELAKGDPNRPNRSAPATVLVSVDESTLAGPVPTDRATADGVAAVDGGFVGAETARRLSCDGRVQVLLKDAQGKITGIGRASRVVPPNVRRTVEERDEGRCVFPECARDRGLECHHVQPWSAGGATELSNLVLLCRPHHRLVHEFGWSLRGEAGPHITWIRPDGTPLRPRVRIDLDTC